MSSPSPQAPSLNRPHGWRGTLVSFVTICFRFCIILVALWSARFTIERDHAMVTAEDYRPCAAAMGQHGLQFSFGCSYENVSVTPSLLHQTYQITAPDGATIRTQMAEPTVWNGSVGVERKTAATWLLYMVAAFAVLPSFWLALLRRAGVRPPQKFIGGLRVRLAAMSLALCAGGVFFSPSLMEILALHRIESNEMNSRYTDVNAFATAVQPSLHGELILLGTDNYDRAVRLAGYGCRLYTDAGRPIPRAAFASAPLVKLPTLPAGTRFAGLCFFPQYNHAGAV